LKSQLRLGVPPKKYILIYKTMPYFRANVSEVAFGSVRPSKEWFCEGSRLPVTHCLAEPGATAVSSPIFH